MMRMRKSVLVIGIIIICLVGALALFTFYPGWHERQIIEQALAANDASVCDLLGNVLVFNGDPRTICYAAVAVQRKDARVCADFSDFVGCFANFFSEYPTDDASLCDAIKKQDARD